MLRRPFGSTGVEVAVIGQGTWQIRDHAAAAAALERGLELGMTHVDTAELYENGSRSETLLASVLERRRGDVFLASKVLPRNASYVGTLRACAASLERMKTDRLDLYYLHWWEGKHPISETMRAMGELMDGEKVRFVGVSNLDVDELEQARAALGSRRLVAEQVLYHLGDRGMESDVLPWCRRNGVAVVGYSPFGSGRFPTRGNAARTLAEIAKELGKTPRQVALAFLTRDPGVFAIPKAERVEHVTENSGGAFELPKDAVARIDEAFPMEPGLRSL